MIQSTSLIVRRRKFLPETREKPGCFKSNPGETPRSGPRTQPNYGNFTIQDPRPTAIVPRIVRRTSCENAEKVRGFLFQVTQYGGRRQATLHDIGHRRNGVLVHPDKTWNVFSFGWDGLSLCDPRQRRVRPAGDGERRPALRRDRRMYAEIAIPQTSEIAPNGGVSA